MNGNRADVRCQEQACALRVRRMVLAVTANSDLRSQLKDRLAKCAAFWVRLGFPSSYLAAQASEESKFALKTLLKKLAAHC